MHYHAEQACNGRLIEEPHSPELKQVLSMISAIRAQGWELLRTEFSMFHCGLRLAGQADLLCRDVDGRLVIIDWKRCKQIKFDSFEQMQPPIDHLADCNYWKYCLQLNVYRCPLPHKITTGTNTYPGKAVIKKRQVHPRD